MEIEPIHRSLYIKIRKDKEATKNVKPIKHMKLPKEGIIYSPTESEEDDESSEEVACFGEDSDDIVSLESKSEADIKLEVIMERTQSKFVKKPVECRSERTRKSLLAKQEREKYLNVDCGGEQSYYVKIFVKDGYIFIMKREILELTSRIMKRMLMKQSKKREITSLHFNEIRPDIMKEFCLYATYSFEFRYNWKPKFWLHEDSSDPNYDFKATREKIGKKWEYEFPKFLAYDLYVMANLLMC